MSYGEAASTRDGCVVAGRTSSFHAVRAGHEGGHDAEGCRRVGPVGWRRRALHRGNNEQPILDLRDCACGCSSYVTDIIVQIPAPLVHNDDDGRRSIRICVVQKAHEGDRVCRLQHA